MPAWLTLVLTVAGMVVLVALEAAAVTGSWRTFGVAFKQFGGVVLALAAFCMVFWGIAVFANS